MRCAVEIGVYPGRVGGVLCRCAVGIGGGRVALGVWGRCAMGRIVLVVCGVAVPLGLGGASRWVCLVSLGRASRGRCAVGSA